MSSSRLTPTFPHNNDGKAERSLTPTWPIEDDSDLDSDLEDSEPPVVDATPSSYRWYKSTASADTKNFFTPTKPIRTRSVREKSPVRHITFAHEARSSQQTIRTSARLRADDDPFSISEISSVSPGLCRKKARDSLSVGERSHKSRSPKSRCRRGPRDPISAIETPLYTPKLRKKWGSSHAESVGKFRRSRSFEAPLTRHHKGPRDSQSGGDDERSHRSKSPVASERKSDPSHSKFARPSRSRSFEDPLARHRQKSSRPRSFEDPLARHRQKSSRSRSVEDPLARHRQKSSRSRSVEDPLARHRQGSRDSLSDSDRSYPSKSFHPSQSHSFQDAIAVSERMMASSEYDGKIRSTMESLSMNKLQYDKVSLVGREKEIKVLKDCFTRTMKSNPKNRKKELVLIRGYSGVGKSSLVSSLLEECDQSEKGLNTRGKFDCSSGDVPYTAIASAYGQIFDNIEKRGPPSGASSFEFRQEKALGHALVSTLGSDVHLLARLIPRLENMIPDYLPPRPHSGMRNITGFGASQKQWEYAFRALTRELNKIYSPFVLCLDDMHWADRDSLNLIDCLLSDVENENPFMVIGCYRSNAVVDSHVLPEKLQQLEIKKDMYRFNVSEIEIGNLDKQGVQDVIRTLLSIDDNDQTEALADICFRRTLGNPFFLIEFMTMLKEQELLTFNLGSLKWSWSEEEVDRETMSTGNVVYIVHSRMTKLAHSAQRTLQYAACLGSTIRVECLEILTSNVKFKEGENLADLLLQLEKGGFIEQIKSNQYQWVHENVRESARLLGNASTALFQFDVGNTLFNSLDDSLLEELLFEVCDLINLRAQERKTGFAQLNLRAAEKARSFAAFQSAATYAAKGIAYLENDKWTEHYNLTLQLYTLAMEMTLAIGQIDKMEKHAEAILAQPNCTALEKLPVYLAINHKMIHIDIDHKGCTKFLLRFLAEEFRIRFPRNRAMLPIQACTSLFRVTRVVKKLPKAALSDLKRIKDAKHLALMDLLVRLSTSAYLEKKYFLYILCTTRLVQMTLKHGVHPMSGYSFLTLGLCMMMINGDASEGRFYATMADELQHIVPDTFAAANTTTIANIFVHPWRQPLQLCRMALKEGYSSGMRVGNTEMAMLALIFHNILIPLQMGKSLGFIESKCATIAAQCEEMKLGRYSIVVRLNWHMILELMGQPDESVFVNSDVLQAEGWEPEKFQTEIIGLQVAVYTGDYQAATELALEVSDGYQKAYPNNLEIMSGTFLRAIALYATASTPKARRTANRLTQKIGRWVKKGNPNVGHLYLFLSAEKARLDGRYEKANKLFVDSIILAARTGYVQHAALANERFASFLLHCMNDKEEASYRIQQAIRFYDDWGAAMKVEQLSNLLLSSIENR